MFQQVFLDTREILYGKLTFLGYCLILLRIKAKVYDRLFAKYFCVSHKDTMITL